MSKQRPIQNSDSSYRDVAHHLMSRIMVKTPVHYTKEQLRAKIDSLMPDYKSQASIDAWNTEKEIAIAEWNADLPILRTGVPVACPGGPLVPLPVSRAMPVPLPCEKREQTDFLK
jgi:hypothetical protein